MRRIVAYALAFIAVTAALLGALYAANASTAVLRQGEALSPQKAAEGCALSGWTQQDGGGTYTFRFRVEDGTVPLSLAVSNVASFTFAYNDQVVYRYDDREPAARLKVIDLPQTVGVVTMQIQFDSPQKSVRAQLSTSEQADRLNVLGALLFAFCLGCQLLMLLYCMSLWAQKRDEVILSLMMLLIVITIARDFTQPFALLPQYIPTMLKTWLNLALIITMALLSAWYVAPGFCSRRGRTLVGLVALAVAAVVVSYAADFAFFLPIYGLCCASCAAILVYGCVKRVPWTRPMLACLAFFCASFMFYTSVDTGATPAGTLAVQGYVIQLGCLPFLFACMVAINSRFVGYYRDLKRINAELDELVEQRVHELRIQEEQKHQLMTNVFHDLRSPLFVAKGCVQQLREHRDEERAVALLGERIDFMDQLTQDLFTIAKLESGELLMVEDEVDLSALCEREAQAIRMQCADRNVRFNCRVREGCRVWGDQLRLEQAVQNLLTNAVAHTPEGGLAELRVEEVAGSVRVAVGNTGAGIDPADEPFVFDRYYRVSAGGSNESSGLGLAIVNEIVKAHRGTVELRNQPGEGVAFVLSFPAMEAAPDSSASE